MYIYILLIYSRAILSFAWLTGYATRRVVLSETVHTDSFTAHNKLKIALSPVERVLGHFM